MLLDVTILSLYWLIFFYGLLSNPFQLATSELLSTFFPTWIWQGREWAKGRIPKYDQYYWINAHAHPVISTFYPISTFIGLCASFLSLDKAFTLFVFSIIFHFIFCSIGWYLLFKPLGTLVALLGAITFTYQAYHIRQQPCIVYTLAWFPWIAICPWLAIGMILLAGYYPLALYLLPAGLFLCHNPIQWAIGFAIGSIQLIPFLRYLPKTIRTNKKSEPEVGPWETNFYFGLIPIILLILNPQWRYLWLLAPIVGSYALRNYLPRVYQRAWLLSAYVAVAFSLPLIPKRIAFLLLLLQGFDLWLHNHSLIPTRPYCELYRKPSSAFKGNRLVKYLESHLGEFRVSGLPFPLFTGHINRFKTLGYSGGMQLKLMAKWRNDANPNGSGEHDYFRSNSDTERLTRHRVLFAYTRQRPDRWLETPIQHLWRNPAF